MHSTEFKKLTERFEKPEREAWQKPAAVLDLLGDLQDKTVADIGAGTGYFSARFARAGARVIALDVDDRFLDYMRARKERDQPGEMEIRKTGYDRPELEAGEADLIFLSNVYHHIENRRAYFEAARAGLKPDGRLVVVDFRKAGEYPVGPPPGHRVSHEQAQTELEAAGFGSFEIDDSLLPYQYILIARPK